MQALLAAMVVAAFLIHPSAAGAAQRTFVSANGDDAHPCSLALPCRGFATAITHTDPNGEIIVLDSAGYGAVTITQGVSIIAPPGIYGGMSVFSSQDGVTINTATEKVVLRGLSINGQGGTHGVRVIQAAQVQIEDCEISNMAGDAVRVEGGVVHVAASVIRTNAFGVHVTGSGAKVYVDDTRVANSTNRGIYAEAGTISVNHTRVENSGNSGMEINPAAAGTVRASIRDSAFVGNGVDGVLALAESAGDVIEAVVEHSTAWQNALDGFGAQSFSTGTVVFILSDSVSSRNGEHGFAVTGPGTKAAVSGSTLSNNVSTGMIQTIASVLNSHGNNALNQNGSTDVSGSITTVGLQ